MLRRLAILAMPFVVTACGDSAPLRPAAGQSLPVKPAMASTTPSPDDLLEPTSMAHPERTDELVTRSQPRESDRFDLPPAGASVPANEQEPEPQW
jgi:hypothetical protein